MTQLDDLEITKLCAKAMGLELGPDWDQGYVMLGGHSGIKPARYDPLHDKAQAFELVEKFELNLDKFPRGQWKAEIWLTTYWQGSDNEDLSRAICECVAKMQLAKESAK